MWEEATETVTPSWQEVWQSQTLPSRARVWHCQARWQAYLPILAQTVKQYYPYGPRFPLDVVQMASSTSLFAAAIAWDGIENDNKPLGSGRLLWSFVFEKNLCL